jgi:hypothetical protein
MKNFREDYKTLARAKKTTAYDVMRLCIYKAMDAVSIQPKDVTANQLIRRAFTPITRKNKLDNGNEPWQKVRNLLSSLHWFCKMQKKDPAQLFSPLETVDELNQFTQIVSDVFDKYKITQEEQKRHYSYIFVRQDISPEYQLVQAAHVAAKMGFNQITFKNFDELYFAVIGVPDQKGLDTAIADIEHVGGKAYSFIEPDIGNVMTAVASSPILASNRKRLLSYKKLVFQKG